MARTKETARKASGGGGPRDAFGGKPLPRSVYGGKPAPAPPMTSQQVYREGRSEVATERGGDEQARQDRRAQAQAEIDMKDAQSLSDADHEADLPPDKVTNKLLVKSKTARRQGRDVMQGAYNDRSFVETVLHKAEEARENLVKEGLESASEMDVEEEDKIIEDAVDDLHEYREQRSAFMRELGEVLDVLVEQSRDEFMEEYRELMRLKQTKALPTELDERAKSNMMLFEQSQDYYGYTPQVVSQMEEGIERKRQALEEQSEGEDDEERKRKLSWLQEASLQALVRETVEFWQKVERERKHPGVVCSEGAPSVLPEARGGGGKGIQRRMSGKGGLGGGKGVSNDFDVSTDDEVDEEEYVALVDSFRKEKKRSEEDMPLTRIEKMQQLNTLVCIEKMKHRTHRGHGRLIASHSPYLSPQPWSPSYQFPMQPLTLLEADEVGSVIFGDVVFNADDMEEDADTWHLAYDTDGVKLPKDGWHSWRRHFRDAMRKLQAEGHLQGGEHKMLEKGKSGDVDMPYKVVGAQQEQLAGDIGTLRTFSVRAAVEFSTKGCFDLYSRADDPLYDDQGPKFWPQQLSISVKELQKKERGKKVTIAKDVAEYRVYENLEIKDKINNTLSRQELVALRYFPQHWAYHVMTQEERETSWGRDLKAFLDLGDEDEDEKASDIDVGFARTKMFDFVSQLQQPKVSLFAAPSSESTGAEEPAQSPRESVRVVVESGGLMTIERRAEVATEMLLFRTQQLKDMLLSQQQELAEMKNSENDQRRKHNMMLNKEEENGLKLSHSLLELMQLNQSLSDTVRAQRAELAEFKTASQRPSAQGDAAHPQLAFAAASSGGEVDSLGWSRKKPISGTGQIQDLALDADMKKRLVESSQDLFDNVRNKAYGNELAAACMKRKLDFWKKTMRVRTEDWPLLMEGKLYFDFLDADGIDRRALYALYEVVVLNISPDADGVYKMGMDDPPMKHESMVELDQRVDPCPIGPNTHDLPASAQERVLARRPASKGAGSSASGAGDGDGTPATEPALAPIVATPSDSPTPGGGEPSAGSPASAGHKRPLPNFSRRAAAMRGRF